MYSVVLPSLPIIGVLVDIGMLGLSIIKEGMGDKWRLLLNMSYLNNKSSFLAHCNVLSCLSLGWRYLAVL